MWKTKRRLRLVPTFQIYGPLDSVLDQFPGIAQSQLFLDMGLVGFDGFDAEVQFVRDLPCSVSFADQAKDFQLAIGEIH